MQALLLIIHVLVAVSLIALVLLQHGKGADAGAGVGGGGASNTMFGSQGSTPVLIKITAGLAALFFATSIGLSYFASLQGKSTNAAASMTQTVPDVPVNTGFGPSSPESSQSNTNLSK